MVKDCVLQGVHLKVDDMVAVASAVHGVDERIWNDPLEVNFSRNVQKHATFGNGIHRCPGSNWRAASCASFYKSGCNASRISALNLVSGRSGKRVW